MGLRPYSTAQWFDKSEFIQLLLETHWAGFQFINNGVEVEGQMGWTIGVFGIVFYANGLDRVERQVEMLQYALAHFKARECLAASPVEDSMKVAAFAQFEQSLCHVTGRAGLTDFVAE